MLRGVLGIASGVLLANSFTTYGGAGVSFLLIAADQHTPQDLAFRNIVLGAFGVVMAILMLGLAVLLFAEFLRKKVRFTKILSVVIVPMAIVFSLIHIAAYLGLGKIQDVDLGKFIDGFVLYAAQALAALVLFVIVRRMTPQAGPARGQPTNKPKPD